MSESSTSNAISLTMYRFSVAPSSDKLPQTSAKQHRQRTVGNRLHLSTTVQSHVCIVGVSMATRNRASALIHERELFGESSRGTIFMCGRTHTSRNSVTSRTGSFLYGMSVWLMLMYG